MNTTINKSVFVLGIAGALSLAGCSSESSERTTDTVSTSPQAPTSATAAPPSSTAGSSGSQGASGAEQAVDDPNADLAKTTFPVDMDRALSVARGQMPGATMTKLGVEFDKKLNRWVWRIDEQKGTAQRELKIDAASGKVVGGEAEHESGTPRAVDPTKLTPQAATAKATAVVPGSVAEWALEWDDGVQRYKFEIRTSGTGTQKVIVAVDSGEATRK